MAGPVAPWPCSQLTFFMPEAKQSEPDIPLVLQFLKYAIIYRTCLTEHFLLFMTFKYEIWQLLFIYFLIFYYYRHFVTFFSKKSNSCPSQCFPATQLRTITATCWWLAPGCRIPVPLAVPAVGGQPVKTAVSPGVWSQAALKDPEIRLWLRCESSADTKHISEKNHWMEPMLTYA